MKNKMKNQILQKALRNYFDEKSSQENVEPEKYNIFEACNFILQRIADNLYDYTTDGLIFNDAEVHASVSPIICNTWLVASVGSGTNEVVPPPVINSFELAKVRGKVTGGMMSAINLISSTK